MSRAEGRVTTVQVVLMGPPGSGRRTQTLCLAGCLGVTPISRNGATADDLPEETLTRALDKGGFILDGYPATIDEARALDGMLAGRGAMINAVIMLNVSPSVRLCRLAQDEHDEWRGGLRTELARHSRVWNEQRVYDRRVEPVLDHYRARGIVEAIDGVGSVAEVALRAAASLRV